jgi:hypothetical protein
MEMPEGAKPPQQPMSMFELVAGMMNRRDFIWAIRDVSLKLAADDKNPPALKRVMQDLAHAADTADALLFRLTSEMYAADQRAKAEKAAKEKAGEAKPEEKPSGEEAPKAQ